MMAKDKDFTDYYSNRTLAKEKFPDERLYGGRGCGFGLYCGYPKDESLFIYSKKREKCAADYFTGELGGAMGI